MRGKIKKLFVLLVIFGVILFYITYFLYFLQSPTRVDTLNKIVSNKTKYLLYWSPFWTQNNHYIGNGFEPFRTCEYKNCFATDNRTFLPLQQFDALMFHDPVYRKKKYGVPRIRMPHQMYIYVNTEAPTNYSPNLKRYKSYFNWTMTYRFDSDLIRRQGYVIQAETGYTIPSKEFVKNKTRIAAWFVSHCHTVSRREYLTKKIENYMPVDIYGKCGKMQCLRKKGSKLSSDECYDMIEKKYKFYFSFENSYCKDYATEKLYSLLRRDIVPVVYGAGDYKLSAPRNSVINVADFQSVKELTDYLKYLNENTDEYLKYFEWKKMYKVAKWLQPTACHICKKLHEDIKQSVYHNLHRWWWGKHNKICKRGKALPKIVTTIK